MHTYTLHISNGCQGRIWVAAAEPIFDTEYSRLRQTRIENPTCAEWVGGYGFRTNVPVQVGVVLWRGELDSRKRILAVSEVAI
jgi:hypothetical protein